MYSENNVIKIAITGKLRSGKDSAAWHLFYAHDFAVPIAFGTTLKNMYHSLFPWVNKDAKPREAYQKFGQLMREQFDEDVWVKHAARSVDFALDSRKTVGVVISDLRQPNEYEWAKSNGFIIVRVTAPDELRIERAKAAGDDFSAEDLAHDTEQHVDGFAVDYEVVNDGSLADLYAQVDAVMDEIRRKGSIE